MSVFDDYDDDYDPEEQPSMEKFIAQYHRPNYDDTVLAGIEQIDWPNLHHAYGAATDVPALLNATLSTKRRDKEFAWELLHQTVWHQGTIYQATGYVVPFLLKMLSNDEIIDKASILYLLDSIAHGSPSISERVILEENIFDAFTVQQYAERGEDIHAAIQEAAQNVQQAYEEVWRGLELYIALAAYPEQEARGIIPRLITTIPHSVERIISVLFERIRVERNELVNIELISSTLRYILALEPHSVDLSKVLPLFQRLTHDAEPLITQFASIVALCCLVPNEVNERMIQMIMETISNFEDMRGYKPDYPNPWLQDLFEHTFVGAGADALAHLEKSRCIPMLIEGLTRTMTAASAHTVAIMVLGVALLNTRHTEMYLGGNPSYRDNIVRYDTKEYPPSPDSVEERTYPIVIEHTDIKTLTDVQRAAIRAVVENEQVWLIRSNILAAYGLPAERDEARRLLT